MKNRDDFLLLQPYQQKIRFENNLYLARVSFFLKERTVPPHYHPEIEILAPESVKGEMYLDGRKVILDNGSVYAVRPGAVHSFRLEPRGGGAIHVLQINTEECGRLVSGLVKSSIADFSEGLKSMPVDHGASSAELTQEIKRLTQISNRDFPGEAPPSFEEAMGDVERIYRILRVLSSEKAPLGRAHKQDAKIRRIIDVIESLASLPTSLDEIARQSAISKFHLCRIFKRATGMTVQTYLNELRINRACRFLAAGDKNVTEACFECGFENLSYFIQVFREKVGVPPKQWALAEKKKRPRITV